jgi:hypothetical protein
MSVIVSWTYTHARGVAEPHLMTFQGLQPLESKSPRMGDGRPAVLIAWIECESCGRIDSEVGTSRDLDAESEVAKYQPAWRLSCGISGAVSRYSASFS